MSKKFTLCTLALLVPTALATAATTKTDVPASTTTKQKTNGTEVMVVIGSTLDQQQQTLEVPRSMTVIHDKHLQNSMAQQISDVLRQTPSISTSDNSRPLAGGINIRGFGNERIHLNVDGVNYQQYSDGTGKSSYFNPLDIDPGIVRAVEITRGADGIAKGSGAIGGQVQVITKGGFDYTAGETGSGAILRGAYGNNPELRQYGGSVFNADKDAAQALHLTRRSFGEIKLNLPDQDGSFRGQQKAVNNDSHSDEVRLKLEQRDLLGDWTSDTQYSEAEITGLPFNNNDSYADQAMVETEQSSRFSQSLSHQYQGKADWQNLKSRLFYQRFERERSQQGQILLGANKYLFDNIDQFNDQSYGLALEQQLQHQLGDFSSRLTSFLQYEHNSFDDKLQDQLKNVQQHYYGDSQGDNIAAGSRFDADWSDWLSAETGLRYDNYRRTSDLYQTFGENKDADWSANVGLTLRPTSWLRLYSRWNQGFRGPNLRELYKKDEWRCHRPTKICYSEPQPDLVAEQSDTLETGIGLVFQQLPYADQLLLKLNWFDTEVDNYIDTAPYMYRLVNGQKVFATPTQATHRDYSSKNIGQLRSRGLEFELTYRYQRLDLFANFSRVRMDVSGVPNFYLGTINPLRQPYENAPQDTANLGLNYQLSADFSMTVLSRHSRDMARLPQLYLDRQLDGKGSTLHNLYLSYQPAQGALQGWTVRAGVENLTDRTYAIWPDPESKTMPGRNWRLSSSYMF